MKRLLNPLIEWSVTRALGVDQYPDMFEKLALQPIFPALQRRVLARRIVGVARRKALVFIHVPKNAGTSIKRALYDVDPGHVTIRFYEAFCPDVLARATTMAMFREPVDRFLSSYNFLMCRGGSDVRIRERPLRRLASITSIDGFLTYLESIRGDWLKVDTFARPQWWYIADRSGTIRINHVWLLARDNEKLVEFLRPFGVTAVPRLNRTVRPAVSLTATQLRRIQALYAIDFELFAILQGAGGRSSALHGLKLTALADDDARSATLQLTCAA